MAPPTPPTGPTHRPHPLPLQPTNQIDRTARGPDNFGDSFAFFGFFGFSRPMIDDDDDNNNKRETAVKKKGAMMNVGKSRKMEIFQIVLYPTSNLEIFKNLFLSSPPPFRSFFFSSPNWKLRWKWPHLKIETTRRDEANKFQSRRPTPTKKNKQKENSVKKN